MCSARKINYSLFCFAHIFTLDITRYDDARQIVRDLRDDERMEDVDGARRGRPRRRTDGGGDDCGGGVSQNVWSSPGAFVSRQCFLHEFNSRTHFRDAVVVA